MEHVMTFEPDPNYKQWKIDTDHTQLRGLVAAFVATFINSYVMVPLLLFLFAPWMKRKECERTDAQPWRALDEGFQSMWSKATIAVSLYGGCILAFMLKTA